MAKPGASSNHVDDHVDDGDEARQLVPLHEAGRKANGRQERQLGGLVVQSVDDPRNQDVDDEQLQHGVRHCEATRGPRAALAPPELSRERGRRSAALERWPQASTMNATPNATCKVMLWLRETSVNSERGG